MLTVAWSIAGVLAGWYDIPGYVVYDHSATVAKLLEIGEEPLRGLDPIVRERFAFAEVMVRVKDETELPPSRPGMTVSYGPDALAQLRSIQIGFPFACFYGWIWIPRESLRPVATRLGFRPSNDGAAMCRFVKYSPATRMAIPYCPAAAGLLANIIAWSVISYASRTAYLRARAALRRRRGLCCNCGHSVGIAQCRCPECGRERSPVRAVQK